MSVGLPYVDPNQGHSMRAWHKRVKSNTVYWPCDHLDEAVALLTTLHDLDTEAFGLEVLSEDGVWDEWASDDGDRIATRMPPLGPFPGFPEGM